MRPDELDAFLRRITPQEQYYLDNPGAPSPRYQTMERRIIRGREVLYFQLPSLKEDDVHLRKDSRFTDVPYYLHTNVNVNYIYSGQCELLIDGAPVTLYKGDIAIFDVDVVRRKLTLGQDDIVINLNMSHDFFDSSFLRKAGEQNIFSDFMLHVLSTSSPVHDHYMIFRSSGDLTIELLFQQFLTEYYSDTVYRRQMMRGYLQLIFLELLRLYHQDSANQRVQMASVYSQNMTELLYYIEQHAADCTLTQMAAYFGYHPKYLSSLLKQMTGSTFKQLQIRQRLKNASQLLLQTDLPIQEIAQQVGAGNLSSFYAAFEKQYGMLPGVYRQQNRTGP